jgi:hypothetical protein
MTKKETLQSATFQKTFKIIFYFCAAYFFLMGSALIFFPGFLIRGFSDTNINPVILGMLRGAGGAILPYSLLYILIIQNPVNRQWALSLLLLANVIAIILDLGSILLEEYKIAYAIIDMPVEIISIIGIIIVWTNIKLNTRDKSLK